MTARHPDPVSRAVVARVVVARGVRDGLRVERDEVGLVAHAIAAVHDAPCEVDAFVDEAVARVPAADLLEDAARHRHGALPHERDVAGALARRGAQAWHPVARPGAVTSLERLDP